MTLNVSDVENNEEKEFFKVIPIFNSNEISIRIQHWKLNGGIRPMQSRGL